MVSHTDYIQPHNLEELKRTLPTLPDNTAVLAGGTDLMPQIRAQHPEYGCILSLCKIPELQTIEETPDGWLKIGAMVSHAKAARHPLIRRYFRGLHMSCSHVGSLQIRNKGTLGGSLMNASPAGDIAPCVSLYGGLVEMTGIGPSRKLPIKRFLSSLGTPAMEQREVLTAIWLPIDRELDSCFVKLGSRREVTIAQISLCAAWKEVQGQRTVLRAVAGAVDRMPCPFPEPQLLADEETADQAAEVFARQIKEIRSKRTHPPKLKITEAEQLYKERAAKGVVYDVMEAMGVIKP